jgi:GT2 family glycosyltransferase
MGTVVRSSIPYPHHMPDVPDVSGHTSALAIVAIGRNEGHRLHDCLKSLPKDVPAVYVDSASTDDSVVLARSLGLKVVELQTPPGVSAARARNEGFASLATFDQRPKYVFFIDGDCVLNASFIFAALSTMEADGQLAVVVGRLTELEPERNVFGRLAALEWESSVGEIRDFSNLGGIMLVRSDDFVQIGGFDTSFIAGEDSELGARLFLAGHRIIKIDHPMAAHRMEMDTLNQWWRRSVRAGHALGQRFFKHGRSPLKDSRKVFLSTIVYGLVIPSATIAAVVAFGPLALALAALYLLPGNGFLRFYRRKGARWGDAITGALFGVLAKFANAVGLLQFLINRLRHNFQIIEYK